jgi:hypothetical protein
MLSAPGVRWLAWSAAALSLVATRCWVLGELVGVREIIPTNEWRRLLQCCSIQAITFVTEVVAGSSFRAEPAGCVASREFDMDYSVSHRCPASLRRGARTPLTCFGRPARIRRWAARRCAYRWCVSPNCGAPGASAVTWVRAGLRSSRRLASR